MFQPRGADPLFFDFTQVEGGRTRKHDPSRSFPKTELSLPSGAVGPRKRKRPLLTACYLYKKVLGQLLSWRLAEVAATTSNKARGNERRVSIIAGVRQLHHHQFRGLPFSARGAHQGKMKPPSDQNHKKNHNDGHPLPLKVSNFQ